jgi:hypothetical protein
MVPIKTSSDTFKINISISKLKNNILKIKVKAWHHHNKANIKNDHKAADIEFRISL